MKTRSTISIALFLALAGGPAWLSGCDREGEHRSTADTSSSLPGLMVEAAWLSGHLSDRDLVVVDARKREDYDLGHIPGAVSVPVRALLSTDPDNAKNLAPISVIAEVFSGAGIGSSDRVVIYGSSNYRDAARLLWALEVHGHTSAAVLNGGLAGWSEAGSALSTAASQRPRARFIPSMEPGRMATQLQVARAIEDPGTVILDSRSPDEYAGLLSAANRKGHIKGAINVEFERNLSTGPDGVCRIDDAESLVRVYRSELPAGSKVITYCNSGNRASVSYLALRIAGFDAAVYDGSWLEWGNDPRLPIGRSR